MTSYLTSPLCTVCLFCLYDRQTLDRHRDISLTCVCLHREDPSVSIIKLPARTLLPMKPCPTSQQSIRHGRHGEDWVAYDSAHPVFLKNNVQSSLCHYGTDGKRQIASGSMVELCTSLLGHGVTPLTCSISHSALTTGRNKYLSKPEGI